jgi:phenylpropionate dioxygenase-like ring-hydroxylating dioxygenase large terminal subunit
MFKGFQNHWTPVLPLTELTSNPQAVELAGERIVLFRDNDEVWHAMLDKCPHRGAALSLGDITEEGWLRCGYHGWRFDGSGRCRGVPLSDLNEAAVDRISATALAVREIGGALWIYTASDPAAEPPDPVVPDSLEGNPRLFATGFYPSTLFT